MSTILKYLRRAVLALLLIFAIAAAAAVIVTRTQSFNRFLHRQLMSYMAANFRGQIALGRLEGSVWSGFVLRDATLIDHGFEIVRVPRAAISCPLLPLLWRTIRLRIAVSDPTVRLVRARDGLWNLADALTPPAPLPSAGGPEFAIYLDSLIVRRGAFEVFPRGTGAAAYKLSPVELAARAEFIPAGVRVDVRVLDSTIGAPGLPSIRAAGSLAWQEQNTHSELRAENLRLATDASVVSVTGVIHFPQAATDAVISIEKLAHADLARLIPDFPLRQNLSGRLSLKGPPNALHTAIAMAAGAAALEGSADADLSGATPRYSANLAIARVDLEKSLRIPRVAGLLEAKLIALGAGTDLMALSAEGRFRVAHAAAGPYRLGDLALTAKLVRGSLQANGTTTAPAGRITFDGAGDLSATSRYRVTLGAEHLNLAAAGPPGLQPTDLNFRLAADGQGFSMASADTRVTAEASRSLVGRFTLDRGAASARISHGRIDLSRAHLEGERAVLDLSGSAGIMRGAMLQIAYDFRAGAIARWLKLAGYEGDASAHLSGTANGIGGGVNGLLLEAIKTRGVLIFDSLHVAGYAVHRGDLRYDLALAGPGAPYGSIGADLGGLQAGVALRHLRAAIRAARGAPHAINIALEATDSAGRIQRLNAGFVYSPRAVSGSLSELALELPDGRWRLIDPAPFSLSPRTVSVTHLRIRNGMREVALDGSLATSGPQRLAASVSRIDLGVLRPFLPAGHQYEGVLSGDAEIGGSGAAPLIGVTANADRLRLDGERVGDLAAAIRYANTSATLDATLRQAPHSALTLAGKIPVTIAWADGLRARLGGDVDLRLASARLDLAPAEVLAPRTLRNLAGLAAIDLVLRGPLTRPLATGSIRIAGVKADLIPLGVTIAEAHARFELAPGELRIVTIAAQAAGGGTFAGGGTVALAEYAPGAIKLNVNFDRWPAIASRRYEAMAGGTLAVDGSLEAPRLRGQIEILNGTVRPDLAFLAASSALAPDPTITVIEDGPPPAKLVAVPDQVTPPPNAPVVTTDFNRLAIDVTVTVHRNTWVRHQDATAELEGHVHIAKRPDGPVALTGVIRTVRGWIAYQGRRFDLAAGNFTFDGGPKIDPALDIDARHLVSGNTIDVLIGGTSSHPTLNLRSQPEMTQADILSLLLFGKTTSALGQSERAGLQQQAAKMMAGAAASEVGKAIAESLGIETLGVQLSDISTAGGAVGFGRYLGENTYVSASQDVAGAQGRKVSVQYYITRWLSVTTTSASDGSHEIDLKLTRQF